jgi:coenzyme F420 hydrogenase subunit delta
MLSISKTPSAVVFGCGNPLIGDDGFGPAVIEGLLQRRDRLPYGVSVADVGTGIREYLFDYLLSEQDRPRHLIIVDAVDRQDKKPGELFEIDPSAVPAKKLHDFSLHQFPTVNLLQELQEYTAMKVTILVAQIDSLPQEVAQGLSPAVAAAVPQACARIMEILSATQNKGAAHDV